MIKRTHVIQACEEACSYWLSWRQNFIPDEKENCSSVLASLGLHQCVLHEHCSPMSIWQLCLICCCCCCCCLCCLNQVSTFFSFLLICQGKYANVKNCCVNLQSARWTDEQTAPRRVWSRCCSSSHSFSLSILQGFQSEDPSLIGHVWG